ncbi:MAG TPA: hypothetical protein VKY74_24545, partial [Chloroflexia bacterium]|nr:hypothetical protein [Chloroflexia bacterium]
MRHLAISGLGSAAQATAVGVLLAGGLLVAACGSAAPQVILPGPGSGASRPLIQAGPTATSVIPHQLHNGTTGGSIGPELNTVPLPNAPATATPAAPAAGPGTTPPP